MAESTIPVDLFNPGQVFACLGLMEAAECLIGRTFSRFDWEREPTFRLRSFSRKAPADVVLDFLASAEVEAHAPAHSTLLRTVGKIPVKLNPVGTPYPFPELDKAAQLPARLVNAEGECIPIDHWGDKTRRDSVKFWGASGGRGGADLVQSALELVRTQLPLQETQIFSMKAPQTGGFRLDFRRDYIPIDAGFSPNKHTGVNEVYMGGYPLVELLAAIGLTHARPVRYTALSYGFSVCGSEWFPANLMRASLGSAGPVAPGMKTRQFKFMLGYPGRPKTGEPRAITKVTEEIN